MSDPDIKKMSANILNIQKQLDAMAKQSGGLWSSGQSKSSFGNKSASGGNIDLDELQDSISDLSDEVSTRAALLRKSSVIARKQTDIDTDVTTDTQEYSDVIQLLTASLQKSSQSHNAAREDMDELGTMQHRGINDQLRYLDQHSKVLKNSSDNLSQNIRKSSMLGASMLKYSSNIDKGSLEYHQLISNMYSATDGVNKSMLSAAGILDKSTGKIKEGLSNDDFAKLHVVMGEVQQDIAAGLQGIAHLGYDSLGQVMSEGEISLIESFNAIKGTDSSAAKLRQSMINMALTLESQGHNLDLGLIDKSGPNKGNINGANLDILGTKEGSEQLVAAMAKMRAMSDSNTKAHAGLGNQAFLASTKAGAFALKLQEAGNGAISLKGGLKMFGSHLAQAGTIAANFSKAKDAIKGLYDQMVEFNVAQIPKSFMDVQGASIAMGMSFEKTVEFMQANKSTMAAQGKNWDKTQGDIQKTMLAAGYNMSQAASSIAPMIANAGAAGINVRDGDALNKFIADTTKSFQRVSSILPITLEEYQKMNNALLDSSDTREILMGQDKDTAAQTWKSMELQRNKYATDLGSYELATKMIQAQQQAAKAKVVDRFKSAAMLRIGMQQAGMSEEQISDSSATILKGKAATQEEKDRLTKNMGQMRQTQEEQIQANGGGNYGTEVAQEITTAGIGSNLTNLGDEDLARRQRERSGQNITEAEKNKQESAAKPSSKLAEGSQLVNQATSLIDNGFTKALTGSIGGMIGLTVSALNAARTLNTLSGGKGLVGSSLEKVLGKTKLGKAFGIGESVVEGASGIASKAGTLGKLSTLGKLAKGIGPGLLTSAAGMAFDYGGDKLVESGHERLGGTAKTLGKGAEWAGAGALLGSVVPGLGTAIGAGVGGAAGLAYGAYENWNDMFHKTPNIASPIQTNMPGISQPVETNNKTVVNTLASESTEQADKKTLIVQDTTSQGYLATLVENMTQSVALLQKLVDVASDDSSNDINSLRARLAAQPITPLDTKMGVLSGRVGTA